MDDGIFDTGAVRDIVVNQAIPEDRFSDIRIRLARQDTTSCPRSGQTRRNPAMTSPASSASPAARMRRNRGHVIAGALPNVNLVHSSCGHDGKRRGAAAPNKSGRSSRCDIRLTYRAQTSGWYGRCADRCSTGYSKKVLRGLLVLGLIWLSIVIIVATVLAFVVARDRFVAARDQFRRRSKP